MITDVMPFEDFSKTKNYDYINPQKFRRDKLSDEEVTEGIISNFSPRPKVYNAETFGKIFFF